MVNKPCDHCGKVKRLTLKARDIEDGPFGRYQYLCRPCARTLGFETPNILQTQSGLMYRND